MFSSTEMAVAWAADVLEVQACTHVPRNAQGSIDPEGGISSLCLVERTGGRLDYPHDSPEFAFQCWCRSEADAEQLANVLAIAAKLKPPTDTHVNATGVPTVLSYGLMDGGWFVWQTNVSFEVSLLD